MDGQYLKVLTIVDFNPQKPLIVQRQRLDMVHAPCEKRRWSVESAGKSRHAMNPRSPLEVTFFLGWKYADSVWCWNLLWDLDKRVSNLEIIHAWRLKLECSSLFYPPNRLLWSVLNIGGWCWLWHPTVTIFSQVGKVICHTMSLITIHVDSADFWHHTVNCSPFADDYCPFKKSPSRYGLSYDLKLS